MEKDAEPKKWNSFNIGNMQESEKSGGVPKEILAQLQTFHEKLSCVEESFEKYFSLLTAGATDDSIEQLGALDRARLDLMAAYTANSLFWIYLCAKGVRPSENDALKTELERIKEYMSRMKAVEDRLSAPKLNPHAVKAFVRNALWEPAPADADVEDGLAPAQTKECRSSCEKVEENSLVVGEEQEACDSSAHVPAKRRKKQKERQKKWT